MARPKKDNAEYHTHDKDMRNDPKIRALRKKFGHEGYAIYNMMLEVLTDSDHFRYEWNPMNIEILSGDFDTDNLEPVIKYCTEKLQLFTIENGFIFSFQHQNRFKPLLSKRKRDISGFIASENPHSIVKYNKVEESKGKNELNADIPKENISPKASSVGTGAVAPGHQPTGGVGKKKGKRLDNPDSVQPVQEYFSEKMKGKWAPAKILRESEQFFNHYTANGWVQNKGKPIVNWKAAVNNWIMNEFNGSFSVGRPSNTSPPVQVSEKSQAPPPEKQLSEAEKQQLSRDFMQDCYTDFCEGKMLVLDGLQYYYNQLVMDGLLILTESDKERIKKAVNGDLKRSKITAVEEYFTRMKKQGVKRIYQIVSN